MKKPKLSEDIAAQLKEDKKKDKHRRLVINIILAGSFLILVMLVKVFFLDREIRITSEEEKTPAEKIEGQPTLGEKSGETVVTTTSTTTTKPAPSFTEYTVLEGDTLGAIANANGLSSQQLMDYNGITDPLTIKPGQIIKIPK